MLDKVIKYRKNAGIIVIVCGVILALLGAFSCVIMLIITAESNADIFFAVLGLILILLGALLFWFGWRLSGTNSHLTDLQSSPQTAADSERRQQPCTRD